MPLPIMHNHGLEHDLSALARQHDRRQILRWLSTVSALGATGTMPLLGCGGGGDAGSTATSSSTGTSTTSTSTTGTTTTSGTALNTCSVAPEETAGPYPGDGSNTSNGATSNALMLASVVRSDIRSSIDGATGTAAGVPLVLTIQLTNTNASCASLEGYAIYLWHCNRDGKYSLYSSGVTDQNYLRGVQATDASGNATFTTIFPGCYDGRMPHMHLEIYRSLNTATSYTNKLKTTQLAFPVATCTEVYTNASGYSSSLTNLNKSSFATDNVFSDGVTLEMTTLSGSVAEGYTGNITLSIAA
ncbi:MAG TPA: intradiol ring-cleavage dioxygenase [Aquabacterium sp.]|uniref:dioxygenase family protein n=1 Tax=Aquabacterium sp. TaxID=1872578 RepID=UPI002E2F4741|nr:intradiol ring-cleavage dioxygenase [Aquabacterium sp.]HEX5357532.1 intradiol ring-cleavage dioxygenase [Aquabacterium sp.]